MISAFMDKPWYLKGEFSRNISEFVGINFLLNKINSNETLYETNIKHIIALEESSELSLLLSGLYRSGKTILSQIIAADRKSIRLRLLNERYLYE